MTNPNNQPRTMTLADRHWRVIPEEFVQRSVREYCDSYGIAWEYRQLLGSTLVVYVTSAEMTTIYREMGA